MASTKKNQAGIKQSALLKWVRPGNYCSQKAENAISNTLCFKIFRASMPRTPLAARAFGTPDWHPTPAPNKSNLATELRNCHRTEQNIKIIVQNIEEVLITQQIQKKVQMDNLED